MGKRVVIVESPTKAKTINKFLGSKYVVRSSMGHVRDLPERKLAVDVEKDFEPEYRIIPSREEVVKALKEEVKGAEEVYLAPDKDREGEAIAWHLSKALDIPEEKVRRVIFNEITPEAIHRAFEHTTPIDMNKVNAQQARRILDRLVGYKISPLLRKKVTKGLSAGRVQSVAVRLLVEREKEIQAFVPQEYWEIDARLMPTGSKEEFLASLWKVGDEEIREPSEKLDGLPPKLAFPDKLKDKIRYEAERRLLIFKGIMTGNEKKELQELSENIPYKEAIERLFQKSLRLTREAEAQALVATLKKERFIVEVVKKELRQNNPPPPFITSQLQQQAAVQLGFATKRTMLIAQQLYEGVELKEGPAGLITYMRTDSYHIAEEALKASRKLILEKYGEKYLPPKPNFYPSRKGAQEAHEAIRPTFVELVPEEVKNYLTKEQYKLYELIWRRFVASQMNPIQYETTDVTISAGLYKFRANGRIIIFPGHNILTRSMKEEPLPKMQEGEELKLLELTPSQHFTEPPPRYTEAALVKALERKSIGRPSTYAIIISTIQDRGYVKKENKTLHPTELGILVTEKLILHFPRIMDVEFTSSMEEQLDRIEEAKADWVGILKDFYTPFKVDLEKAMKEMKSEKGGSEETNILCELCKSPMVVRWGKAGKFLGCSAFPKCKFTKDLSTDKRPVEVTQQSCEKCGSPMVVKRGPTGSFLACSAYPKCRNTKSLPTGVKCPEEGCGGELVVRRSKQGRRFFGCSNYPRCNYVTNKLPQESTKKEAPVADLKA